MSRVPYTFDECEEMFRLYDEDNANPLKVIAENINEMFHNGHPIRNIKSVRYGVMLYNEGKIKEPE